MKKPLIVTVGGLTEDVFFSVDDFRLVPEKPGGRGPAFLAFEYGGKVGISALSSSCGGGAANAAVSFSRLGFKTAIIGDIGGDDRGRRIAANLAHNKVKLTFLDEHAYLQSGVSYILVTPNHEHIVFTYRGANGASAISRAEASVLSRAGWTYLTSLSGAWKKVAQPVFSHSQKVAWNPGREQIAAGLKVMAPFLKKTSVLICNRAEATSLVMSGFKTQVSKAAPSLAALAKILHAAGPRLVLITDGEKGAGAYDGRAWYAQKAQLVKRAVNTTGVGDAFGSSFVAGLELHNGDIARALELASRNAASVVAHQGAQAGLLRL